MQQNPPISLQQLITATMIGTTIEYFDNYIYAIAAVLIFNHQFFYSADPVSNQIAALSTLALTFIARPLGAALFGHFGDRIGRKNTLVISLLLMGSSTIIIGLLPTYEHIGIWATLLLCLCRIGQGIGLGGEWGGAALVAIENAPQNKRGWYGTFPQLGAPIGLLLANGIFLLISLLLGDQALLDWAWRIPFISSIILIFIGLYVRLKLVESPIFITATEQKRVVNLPIKLLFSTYTKPFLLGMLLSVAGYVLFYIMIAFTQVYAKSPVGLSPSGYSTGLGFSSGSLTFLLMCSACSLAFTIYLSGFYIDRIGRRSWMIITTFGVTLFGLSIPFFLENATILSLFFFFMIGMGLIGMGYGPLASLLPELFPTEIRYSGASLAYNCAGILGASVATLITIPLNNYFGLWGVGIYLSANGLLSLVALWKIKETKENSL
ncbi:MFS transporter [Rodentibacter caecimuris]